MDISSEYVILSLENHYCRFYRPPFSEREPHCAEHNARVQQRNKLQCHVWMSLVLQTVQLLHAALCFVLFHPIPVLFTSIYTVACFVSYLMFFINTIINIILEQGWPNCGPRGNYFRPSVTWIVSELQFR